MKYMVVLALFLVPLFSHAEYIESFEADIVAEDDGSFRVTERIEYVFTNDKHGIFRYIPTTHQDAASSAFKERYIDIELESITVDGMSVPYEEQDEDDQLFIKIGDPDMTITGAHTYEIVYDVMGAISYPQYGGADLYWNVTGSHWDVPMKRVEVRVSSPEGVLARERSCYKGPEGLAGSCGRVFEEDGEVIFSAGTIGPREGVTISQALNRSKIEYVLLERWKPLWLWIPIFVVWFSILGVFVYRYKTAHKTERTIIPQYEPYPGVRPMYTGLLFDGKLDPQDITACIVYLAEQGFLKIRKTESKVMFFFEVDDYEITLLKPLDETVSRFERSILSLLFDHGAVVGAKITLNTLKKDAAQRKENYETLTKLKDSLEQDLEDTGFFQVTVSSRAVMTTLGLIAFVLLFSAGSWIATTSPHVIFGGILLIGSIILLSFSSRRRTQKGYEALDHLKGFKQFLSVTEKERYEFHNAPEKSPEQFMEYLPYAIAFGVDEKWAESFKDIAIEDPDWYDGGTAAHSFSATNLTSSLGAFSTAFAASSGSSRSSSGGGSVGGGGGGGGGGSW